MLTFSLAMAVAIVCSVAGDFFVKQGAADLKAVDADEFGGWEHLFSPANLGSFFRQSGILSNRKMFAGIFLLALHFAGFMLAMNMAAVTVVVPLMSCTYVATTVLGRMALREQVSPLRIAGVATIVAGVALLGISTLGTTASQRHQSGTVGALSRAIHRTNEKLPLKPPT